MIDYQQPFPAVSRTGSRRRCGPNLRFPVSSGGYLLSDAWQGHSTCNGHYSLLDMTLKGQMVMDETREDQFIVAKVRSLRSRNTPRPVEMKQSLAGQYNKSWCQARSLRPPNSYDGTKVTINKEDIARHAPLTNTPDLKESSRENDAQIVLAKNVIRMPAIKRSSTTPQTSARSRGTVESAWSSRPGTTGTNRSTPEDKADDQEPSFIKQATVTRLPAHLRGLSVTADKKVLSPRGPSPTSTSNVDKILKKQKRIENEYKSLRNISTGSIVNCIFDRLNETKSHQRTKAELEYLTIVGIKPLHSSKKTMFENDVLFININNQKSAHSREERPNKMFDDAGSSHKRNVNDIRYTGLDSTAFDYSSMDFDALLGISSPEASPRPTHRSAAPFGAGKKVEIRRAGSCGTGELGRTSFPPLYKSYTRTNSMLISKTEALNKP